MRMGLEILGYINNLKSTCIRQDMEGTKERVLIGSKFQLRQLSRYKCFYSKKKCNRMLQKEEGNTLNFDHSIFAMTEINIQRCPICNQICHTEVKEKWQARKVGTVVVRSLQC